MHECINHNIILKFKIEGDDQFSLCIKLKSINGISLGNINMGNIVCT